MPHVATEQHEAVTLLKDLIRFKSLSHEEKEIADYVEQLARDAGLAVERMDDNVYFWLGEGTNRLLLCSHLDVVPPSADHPFDPFEPVQQNGTLWGRGSVDAKASGATMTTALLALARQGWTPPDGQVIVALTACEETGGGYNGMEALRPHLPELSAALVGEPTDLQPCVAQKGLLILKVNAYGRTAHAARSHLGDNAITRAARDIARLDDITFDRDDPVVGTPTVSVTTIEGGTARNMVPDQCSFYVDIRSTPAYSHHELTQQVAELLESDVSVHSERIVPVGTDLDAPIVRACRTALPDAEPFGSPTASDWIFLKDVPTVKIGPGSSQRSHTAHEHIEIAEVERAADVYEQIIRAYYGA